MPVVIGSGSPPFPFRTRKLSLIPPMVLHGKLCGRVGRCRHYSSESPRALVRGLSFVRRHPAPAGAPRTLGGGVGESRSLPALFTTKPDVRNHAGLFLFYAGSCASMPEAQAGTFLACTVIASTRTGPSSSAMPPG